MRNEEKREAPKFLRRFFWRIGLAGALAAAAFAYTQKSPEAGMWLKTQLYTSMDTSFLTR